MKLTKLIIILLMLIIISFLNGLEYSPRELIVKTNTTRSVDSGNFGLEDFDSFLMSQGLKSIKSITKKNDNQYYVITFNNDISWEEIAPLEFAGVEYIQPNYINTMFQLPNDPYFVTGELWGLYQENNHDTNAPEAWNYTIGSDQILIGLVDSGLHFDHPDVQNNVFYNDAEIPDDGIDNDNNGYVDDWRGWDFVDAPELSDIALGDYTEQDNDPTDDINHGTHLAGIIGADTNNGLGVCGVCWNIDILIIRAGFKTIEGLGYLQDDDAAASIIYAADMGADVINISWGDQNYSQIIADACHYAYELGSIVVVSSGNTYGPGIMYPAQLSTTIAVGSVDRFFNRANFSSYGPQLDLLAPGVQIISSYDVTENNLYKEQSGTSMSAPFVSAGIGLLLSVEPGLNFEQVKTRLTSSCRDIGDSGYDIEHGHGVLDLEAFLTNEEYPDFLIEFPSDFQGLNQSFDIIGTVMADNFSKYSIMYTDEELPFPGDWKDINYPHMNTPTYYYEQVENGILGHFDLEGVSSEFNKYQLRVEVMTCENGHYELRRTIFLDQTPPVQDFSLTGIMKRYDDEYVKYFLQTVYDEPVQLSASYVDINNNKYLVAFSNITDEIQMFNLPEPEVDYTGIELWAINQCGLEVVYSPEENNIPLPDEFISLDVNSFEYQTLGNEIIATRKHLDIDGNGIMEFLAQEIVGDEKILKIFEVSNRNLITKHIFDFELWPQDLGFTSEEDISLLGLSADIARLYVSEEGEMYPSTLLWSETNVYGGNFVDIDNDGIDEIAIIKNETDEMVTRRILAIYKRFGNTINRIYTIYNETETNLKNEFVNKIHVADFDQDGNMDVLTSDTDGDVIIYELYSINSEYEMKWQDRLPVPDAYYPTLVDFNGDGISEFCVGGFTRNYADPNKSYSFFKYYSWLGEDDQYGSIGYTAFDHVEGKNSIAVADLDGDGDEEVFLSLPPNSYVIDDVGGEIIPVWKGESTKTYQNIITAHSYSPENEAYIIVNTGTTDQLESILITKSELFTGPITPYNFLCSPLNEQTSHLQWNYEGLPYDYFNIYRKFGSNIILLDTTTEFEFTETGLSAGDTLYYQVSAVCGEFVPQESKPTLWKQVIPSYIPLLILIDMVSSNILELNFDQILNNGAINNLHYEINNGVGLPASVNFINEKRGVILTFNNGILPAEEYSIQITGVQGKTGVPFSDGSYPFLYKEDVDAPRILYSRVEDDGNVKVYFSEPIKTLQAENLSNYTLIPPSNDPDNGIIDLQYYSVMDSFYVNLYLIKNLEYSTKKYFLKIENVEDLNGNRISNNGNKSRFNLTDITNLKHMKVYPNPFYPDEYQELRFVNLPLGIEGSIRIYDLPGDLVFKDRLGPLTESELNNFYSWDGKNNAGNRVASGIYFYVVEMNKDHRKGKFAIIY